MSRVRIEAPAGLDRLTLAQILVGPSLLLKAEPTRHPGEKTFSRYTALQQLTERIASAFDATMRHALHEVHAFVERTVLITEMRKAEGNEIVFPPLFTPAQQEAVRKILTDYMLGFMVVTIDPNLISQHELLRLVSAGIIPSSLQFVFSSSDPSRPAPPAIDWVGTAYRYGALLGSMDAGDDADYVKNLTLDRYESREARRPRPLTLHEQAALDLAKQSAGVHCRGLGNQIADDFSTAAIEADIALRKRFEKEIQDATAANIARRETWRQLATDLGDRTGDWSRGFRRIAATEKQSAFQGGYTSALKKRTGQPASNIRVAKLPAPDACADCLRLHMEGDEPRVFMLSELEANGTNVGVKRPGWQAVVGATHPWCGCELTHVPDGWGFDGRKLMPIRKSRDLTLDHDLRKAAAKGAHLTYKDFTPERDIVVRVGDPRVREEIDKVIARTPKELFDGKVGVTLITTDLPSTQNVFNEHDLAYWTGNEIRLMQTLPEDRVGPVLMHEFGHALNVFLYERFGRDMQKVRDWHSRLFAVSKEEGFISDYASREPIENAAEVTRLYLYDRPRLMKDYPRQFAFAHNDYRHILPAWKWKR